jgi:hypothetical protein
MVLTSVLDLASGKLSRITASGAGNWVDLASGKIDRVTSGTHGLDLQSGKRVRDTMPSASCGGTVDAAAASNSCPACSGAECQTLSGCTNVGCRNLVGWSYTDCDANCHIAVHASVNSGSYFEVADVLACNRSAECGSIWCVGKTNCEGYWETFFPKCGSGGSTSTTYDYRVRLETNGTDTSVSSQDASQITHNPSDTVCIG